MRKLPEPIFIHMRIQQNKQAKNTIKSTINFFSFEIQKKLIYNFSDSFIEMR